MQAAQRLYQTQSWEDPDPIIIGLSLEGCRVFCIDPAGDTAFALTIAGAKEVLCIQPVFSQFALAELKKAAVRMLPVQSVRSFVGLGYFGRRIWFYHFIREGLSEPVRRYWDAREAQIREGLLNAGLREQKQIWKRKWLGRILGTAQLDALAAGRLSPGIKKGLSLLGPELAALQKGLESKDNYFISWIFLGQYTSAFPAYLSVEGHRKLAARMDACRFLQEEPEHYLSQHPGAFDKAWLGESRISWEVLKQSLVKQGQAGWVEREKSRVLPEGWEEQESPGVGRAFFLRSLRITRCIL
jgi:S-adenosylmethionine:diacylglycerol 3-amino-3-carboxypropyl transferase